jgi:hypothetical protein
MPMIRRPLSMVMVHHNGAAIKTWLGPAVTYRPAGAGCRLRHFSAPSQLKGSTGLRLVTLC